METEVKTAVEEFGKIEKAEDTCPRLKSTERTNTGNLEAAEPIRSEAGMALEAVLAMVALEAVVDAL